MLLKSEKDTHCISFLTLHQTLACPIPQAANEGTVKEPVNILFKLKISCCLLNNYHLTYPPKAITSFSTTNQKPTPASIPGVFLNHTTMGMGRNTSVHGFCKRASYGSRCKLMKSQQHQHLGIKNSATVLILNEPITAVTLPHRIQLHIIKL